MLNRIARPVVAALLLASAGCVEAGFDSTTIEEPSSTGGDFGASAPADGDFGASAPAEAVPTSLLRVIDGDSLELDIGGEETEVRLENFNSPELFHFDNRRSCQGEASKVALADALDGRELLIAGDEFDRFDRLLADIFVEGRSVTDRLIADGHGLALRPEQGRRQAMKAAAAAGVGMWGDRCGLPQSPGLAIGETQANPPGPDGENLTEEWVEIVNHGDEPADLDGWVIRDHTTSNRFPLSGPLPAGGRLIVRSGAGTDSPTDRYLGERFPVWSNGDETILLIDPEGVVVDHRFLD